MSMNHEYAEYLKENMDENKLTDEYEVPDAEVDLFSPDTVQDIIKAKKETPGQFQSYWEYDENDINRWTKVTTFEIHSNLYNSDTVK